MISALTTKGPVPTRARPIRDCRPAVTAILVLSVLAPLGCASERAEPIAERTDSAGIEIVVSPPTDQALAASLETDFTLGGEDTDEESFFRVHTGVVGTDDQGRIYVLDTSAYRVVAFDADGNHLWTAGQQGDGPGELGFPAGMVVSGDGEALVMDFSKRGFVGYRDGEPSGSRSLPFPFFGGTLGMQGDDILVMQGDGTDAVNRLVRVPPEGDTTVVVSLQGAPLRSIELRRTCQIGISGMSPLFDPVIRWGTRGDRLAVTTVAAYVIDIYGPDGLARSVRRELPVRPADEAAARAEVGEGMRIRTSAGDQVCDPAEVVEQRGFASELPWIESVALAPDGTLWVERFEPGDDVQGVIDLFDASGEYTGSLPAGTPFPLGFLPDGRVLIREVDEVTDLERLAVQRLTIEGA